MTRTGGRLIRRVTAERSCVWGCSALGRGMLQSYSYSSSSSPRHEEEQEEEKE